MGTADTILALFGKAEMLILLLMAIDSGSAKNTGSNLTRLVGILSIPGVFLELRDFRLVLISSVVVLEPQLKEGIKMKLDCKFVFLRIFTILGFCLKQNLRPHFYCLIQYQTLLFQD